jgi:hypothetical protein
MPNTPFTPADILLPADDIALGLWSVVACDQFTSEREYWERVKSKVGESPSTLKMIIPEVYLEDIQEESEIGKIRCVMDSYINDGVLYEIKDSFVYVERTLSDGQVRKGLVGALDLEEYDYSLGDLGDSAVAAVLASEGTALDRLPPRIRVRQAATFELPHIMVLIADKNQTIIEPLENKSKELAPLYDFELMEGGGRLRGTRISGSDSGDVMKALSILHDEKKAEKPPQCLMIVGDGNHSLAAAKNFWNEVKNNLNADEIEAHPARYALVEVNNLYDPTISFEAIHRVVMDIDADKFVWAFSAAMASAKIGGVGSVANTHTLRILFLSGEKSVTVAAESASALIAAVQEFIDEYISKSGGRIDYIHDIDTLDSLVKGGDSVGILLPTVTKQEYLESVAARNILPRKSFSIGNAEDKRYYMECRRIHNSKSGV